MFKKDYYYYYYFYIVIILIIITNNKHRPTFRTLTSDVRLQAIQFQNK